MIDSRHRRFRRVRTIREFAVSLNDRGYPERLAEDQWGVALYAPQSHSITQLRI
jgi:hypothetical protein